MVRIHVSELWKGNLPMVNNLDALIKLIAEHFIFDENKYPELTGASEQEKLVFALRHSALHFSKTAGKIAAVSETTDHGGALDFDNLKVQTIKSLINTLRLADLIEMDAQKLISGVQELYK